jgi:pre-mRNA-splicing helicase BRR2
MKKNEEEDEEGFEIKDESDDEEENEELPEGEEAPGTGKEELVIGGPR